jgi:hypothetical protein
MEKLVLGRFVVFLYVFATLVSFLQSAPRIGASTERQKSARPPLLGRSAAVLFEWIS